MDKYEYRVKTEQMLGYMEKKQYKKAMEIADTIDWRRVKSASMLSSVSEIYEYNGEYQKSRDILFVAFDRSPGSRKIVYRLGTLALKLNELEEASDCYEEFVKLAPRDPNQYILRYKILKAQEAPLTEQIAALEDFKKAEYTEKWAYELAVLYHEAGMTAECLEECDDLILWFSEGKYVYQAMELKMKYKPLTPLQQKKYDSRPGAPKKTVVKPAESEAVKTAEEVKPEKTVVPNLREVMSAVEKGESEDQQELMSEDTDIEEAEENVSSTVDIETVQPEKHSAITNVIKGATLQEALMTGVAIASGINIEEKAMKEKDEELRINGQMRIDEILQQWEEKQKEHAEAIEIQRQQDEERLQKEREEAEKRKEAERLEIERKAAEAEAARKAAEEEAARKAAEEEAARKAAEEEAARKAAEEEAARKVARKAAEEEAARKAAEEEATKEVPEDIIQLMDQMEVEESEESEEVSVEDITIDEDIIKDVLSEKSEESFDFEEDFIEGLQDAIDDDSEEIDEEDFDEDDFEEADEDDFEEAEEEEFDEDDFEEAEEEEFDEDDFEEAEEEEFDEDDFEEADEDDFEEIDEGSFEEDDFDEIDEGAFDEDDFEEFEEDDFEEDDFDEEDFDEDDFEEVEEEDFDEDDFEEVELPSKKEKKSSKKQRTGSLEIEEPSEEEIQARIKKSKGGGVPFDTGFVVTGRYDLSATSEIGLKAGLTEEQKKLFSYFVPVRGMSEQIVNVLDNDRRAQREGTSKTGNLLVIGRKGSGKTVLAVDIVKAIQKQRNLKQGKVAIVTGDSLNKKELTNIIQKLRGGAIIIEKAGKLNSRTIKELNYLMEKKTGELLFVLEDQRKPLERIMTANPDFKKKFTSKLELPVFINDELVTFGQTYAKENGYKLDEMGILALYSRIDVMQREDHAVTVAEVKEIMDEAIEHSQKATAKHLARRVFGRGTDDSDRVILKEEDFKI